MSHDTPPPTTAQFTAKRRVDGLCQRVALVDEVTQSLDFNSVFLNLYRHEKDSIGFHADDEKGFVVGAPIASVSLGARRRFQIRHKATKHTTTLMLHHGDLLVMGGTMQHHYVHALPKESHACGPRINLTFRHFTG